MTEDEINVELENNMGLVISQALSFHPKGLTDFDDYVQAGRIGLWQATKTFDAKKGKFSTYAIPAIRREIAREINKRVSNNSEELEKVADDEAPTELWEIEPDTLSNQEKKILYLKYIGCSLSEIAEEFGKSKDWASRHLLEVFEKVRAANG